MQELGRSRSSHNENVVLLGPEIASHSARLHRITRNYVSVAERMGIELAVRFSKNAFEVSGEFRLIVPKMPA